MPKQNMPEVSVKLMTGCVVFAFEAVKDAFVTLQQIFVNAPCG